jgi:hypothetical protein
MRFGRVQGHGRLLSDEGTVSTVVVLDSGRAARVIIDASLPWLDFGPPGDLGWQIDQRTQELIGTVLAEEGWEAISQDDSDVTEAQDGLVHSPVYIVRNLMSESGRDSE